MAEFQFLDKRVQRTKVQFYDALFELLKEKKYEQISITDIITLAGYSRGSFYNHYSHKDDLLNEIINSLLNKAKKAQQSTYITKESIDIQQLENEPIHVLLHFKEYGKYYQILLGSNIEINFRDRLTAMFVNIYVEDFEMLGSRSNSQSEQKTINKFHAYGLIGLIIDWIIEDFPTEPEKFSKELIKVFKHELETIHINTK